jgi:hypothetical protein
MGVYWSFLEQNRKDFFFYTFLKIFLQKTNILKRTTLHPRDLNQVSGMKKTTAAQFN